MARHVVGILAIWAVAECVVLVVFNQRRQSSHLPKMVGKWRVGLTHTQAEKATQWHTTTTTTIRPIGSVCGCSALLRANSQF